MMPRPRSGAAIAWIATFSCVLALLVALPATVSTTPSARAASAAEFNAGNIIDDAVFYDSQALDANAIQNFLNQQVRTCRSGYTCLKDYRQNTDNRPADKYCNGYGGAANESAATIIDKVARSCGISQKVLLVLIQKEQSLVTDTAPSDWSYRAATGQGCPDTAACDSSTAGFFYQVYYAARQYEIYRLNPTWWGYQAGRWNNILYNPDRNCGTKSVYIENQATAGLYIYTPYTPNAAALNNLYGTGDGCSSYGNRNFWRIFTDWFGSTRASAKTPVFGQDASVLAVDGNGTMWAYPFQAKRWGDRAHVAEGFGGAKAVVAPGDFNGDLRRDLVKVADDGSVSLLSLGAGDGWRRMALNWSEASQIISAGDFDGDSVPDFLTMLADGTLQLWRGNGYGAFHGSITVGSGWHGYRLMSAGADLDGDKKPDLLATDANGLLWLYRGDGAGGWIGWTSLGGGWATMSAIFSPGDFTGDGTVDLLAAEADGVLWIYRGAGGGNFTRDSAAGSGWQAMRAVLPEGIAPGAPRAFPGGSGDLNSDGFSDVLGRTKDGKLVLYPGNGSGAWFGPVNVDAEWGADRFVPMGDFDGDGTADLGRLTADGRLYLHRGNGNGTVRTAELIGQGWRGFGLMTGGADFDGDRRIDVLARDPQGYLRLYRGNGIGGWISGHGELIGVGWDVIDTLTYAGDFDTNGRGDLVARRTDGSLWLYPLTETRGWGAVRQIGVGWDVLDQIFSPGDFDGGGSDMMGRADNGDLRLYQGNGQGLWRGNRVAGIGWDVMSQIG